MWVWCHPPGPLRRIHGIVLQCVSGQTGEIRPVQLGPLWLPTGQGSPGQKKTNSVFSIFFFLNNYQSKPCSNIAAHILNNISSEQIRIFWRVFKSLITYFTAVNNAILRFCTFSKMHILSHCLISFPPIEHYNTGLLIQNTLQDIQDPYRESSVYYIYIFSIRAAHVTRGSAHTYSSLVSDKMPTAACPCLYCISCKEVVACFCFLSYN